MQAQSLKVVLWRVGRRTRSGFVLMAVLVCLLIVSLLSGLVLRNLLHRSRQQRVRQYEMQSELLAVSALDRAVQQARGNADYEGETWAIPAGEFDGLHSAEVTIQVTGDRIRVEARYPLEHPVVVRTTRTVRIDDRFYGPNS